jgi:hypothetical protein
MAQMLKETQRNREGGAGARRVRRGEDALAGGAGAVLEGAQRPEGAAPGEVRAGATGGLGLRFCGYAGGKGQPWMI